MNIQLSAYLYYLKRMMVHLQDGGLRSKLTELVQVIDQPIAQLDGTQVLAKLRQLRVYDYEALMFSIDSLESAKAAVLYYMILQIFNHRHHQDAKFFTQALIHQLILQKSDETKLLNTPKRLIQNLKDFYQKANKALRAELISSLQEIKQQWNTYFLYELQFMFFVWENEGIEPETSAISHDFWPSFVHMSLVQREARPEQLEPYTLYCYRVNTRLFYAFKSWDGVDCYDQLFAHSIVTQYNDANYWFSDLHQAPPFPYLTTRQANLLKDLETHANQQSSSLLPAERQGFSKMIQDLKNCFYRINFLLAKASSLKNKLDQEKQMICDSAKNLLTMNHLPLDFSQKHRDIIQILSHIQGIIRFIEAKNLPSAFHACKDNELSSLKQKLSQHEQAYSNFHQGMLQAFNQAHDFSFKIVYTPQAAASIVRYLAWSLGLCLSSGLGFSILATVPSVVLGLGLSLYFTFASVAFLGLALGAKAFYLAMTHTDQELSNRFYELLPSWNSPIAK